MSEEERPRDEDPSHADKAGDQKGHRRQLGLCHCEELVKMKMFIRVSLHNTEARLAP